MGKLNKNDAYLAIRHEGPVWQVAWAHPKFGSLLASCSYDGRVLVWKESPTGWMKVKEHHGHESSVNAIAWCPHEVGLKLACASSDGKVSLLSYDVQNHVWTTIDWAAHQIGCNAVAWCPASKPDSLISAMATGGTAEAVSVYAELRLATGGCDNLVKIWKYCFPILDGSGIIA